MDGVASAFVFALLHSLWQCALIGAAAALTLRAMSRASAAARHNVGMLFLVAMALAPMAQFVIYWQAELPPDLVSAPFAPLLAAIGLDASLLTWLVVAMWLAGALFMLARQAIGLRSIAAMERRVYQDLPPMWRARVDDLSRAFRIAGAVAVRLSDDVLTPCVTHLSRAIVWLPASLLAHTPPEHLEALLAHELAHVARKDWLWNGIQCVVEALLSFHPVMWWLSRRIRQEREHACDDLAVAAGGDAIALAEALAALECARHPRLSLAANGGALLHRVTRLVSEPAPRGRWSMLSILGALTICIMLLLTQAGVGGGRLPDLHVSASTSGQLGPGDFRRITANDDGVVRIYEARVDANGQLHEEYRENGHLRPIDATVRAWLASIAQQDLSSGA